MLYYTSYVQPKESKLGKTRGLSDKIRVMVRRKRNAHVLMVHDFFAVRPKAPGKMGSMLRRQSR